MAVGITTMQPILVGIGLMLLAFSLVPYLANSLRWVADKKTKVEFRSASVKYNRYIIFIKPVLWEKSFSVPIRSSFDYKTIQNIINTLVEREEEISPRNERSILLSLQLMEFHNLNFFVDKSEIVLSFSFTDDLLATELVRINLTNDE
jgi:hypothetical protein